MVKKTEIQDKTRIVELQVQINPRGRSVVHGTLLVDSEMRTIKHELSQSESLRIGEFILNALV